MTSRSTTGHLTEIVRRGARVYNEHGVSDEFVALTHPDVEIVAPPQWPEESVYHGHEGLRRVFGAWEQQFDGMHVELHSIEERDRRLLVLGRLGGHSRLAAADVNIQVAWISDFSDDDLILRQQYWFSWDEAREAFRP